MQKARCERKIKRRRFVMFVKRKVIILGKRKTSNNSVLGLTRLRGSPVAAEIQSVCEKSSEVHCCSLAVAAAVGWMTERKGGSSLVGQVSVRSEGIKMKQKQE